MYFLVKLKNICRFFKGNGDIFIFKRLFETTESTRALAPIQDISEIRFQRFFVSQDCKKR